MRGKMIRNVYSAYPKLNQRKWQVLLSFLVLDIMATIACGTGAAHGPSGNLPEGQVTQTGNPLVAQYSISPPAPATVVVEFGPDTTYAFRTSPQSTNASNEQATILVAGMKFGTLYHMRALVTYSDGTQGVDVDHTFQTVALPANRIPNMTVTITPGMSPATGVELLSLTEGANPNQFLALATDPGGNVIWYYDYNISPGFPQPIKLLPNGHMLMVLYTIAVPGGIVREIDLAGNTIREFDYSDVSIKLQNAGYHIQVFSIDHDILQLPNGHLVFLVTDERVFTDLPGYPGKTNVTGTAIVDLDQNLNVAWVWDAFDHLDINRHPIGFPDWMHANALAYSSDDGNLLVSLRHQHWVLKLDYENGSGSGDVLWKLGYQGDFQLSSDKPSDWFYAQHDANFASSNTTGSFQLALFDNGLSRVIDNNGTICATQPPCYSAGAIFDVDETAMTASRLWSYTTPYSFWGGVTRVLPNSDVFIDVTAPADLNRMGSRILEVTPGANPTVVWQLVTGNSQFSYRTIHLPSLYPGVQW